MRFQEGKDLAMFLVGFSGSLRDQGENPPDPGGPLPELVYQAHQVLVARGPVYGHVKLIVEMPHLGEATLLYHLIHLPDQVLEPLELLLAEPGTSQARGKALQDPPYRVEVLEVLQVYLRHIGPRVGDDRNQPLGPEAVQGLPDRDDGDTIGLGDLGSHELLPGPQASVEDVLLEETIDGR